jgi:hypothetical protein
MIHEEMNWAGLVPKIKTNNVISYHCEAKKPGLINMMYYERNVTRWVGLGGLSKKR